MTTYYVLSQAKFGATVITFYYLWSALRLEIAGASVYYSSGYKNSRAARGVKYTHAL